MISLLKRLFLIIFINFIDQNFALLFSKIFIIIPLTFLAFSFYVYKSDKNISSLEAFSFGFFVDLISDSYFGLNTIIFCLTTYLINQNANSFKLFSYLQICLFFGLSASAYVGFSQLIVNLYDYSYTTLLLSLFANIIFCFVVALVASYYPQRLSIKL
jgi:rod shape-determining protein MreD